MNLSTPSTLLVTGGAGFIGSALVRRLIDSTPHTVINVDKLTYAGNLESLATALDHPRHRFCQIDICDADAVRAVFEEHAPDAVIHLAAESHVDRSIDAPGEFIQTNVVGSFTMLSEARRYWSTLAGDERSSFRFLHVSTDEVFGALQPNDDAFTEDHPYRPNSPYAASKAAADHLARAWYHTYKLPVITSNCSNNYGPYQFPEKLIPLVIHNALAGKPIPVYGRGENVRDWLFVDDHARALLAALERGVPGETYAIGGRAERRNIDVVRTICRVLDDELPDAGVGARESLITFVQDRPGHDFRYAIDPSRAERELGWRREFDFEDGIRETVRWYIDNQEWCARVMSGAYRGERLGVLAV